MLVFVLFSISLSTQNVDGHKFYETDNNVSLYYKQTD